MALRLPALVKAKTSTTGTSTYAVNESSPTAGWRSFSEAVLDLDLADGDTIPYICVDTTVVGRTKLMEIGIGTWSNTAKTLTRDTIYQPNASPVSWGAGTRDLVVISNPALFLLLAGGTITGLLKILISGSIITPAAETALVVQRSSTTTTDAGVSIISGTAGKARINLGDTADEKAIAIVGDNNTNSIIFRTNGVDRQVIDSSGVLKVTVSGNTYDAFTGGAATVLMFYQASAPTGWTKVTTQNDKALRVVSGTGGGAGGTRSLSSAVTGDHTLTIAEMPSHHHQFPVDLNATAGSNLNSTTAGAGIALRDTTDTGNGDPHNHPLALAYIDVIVCSKN